MSTESVGDKTTETIKETLLTNATLIGRLDEVVEQTDKRMGNIEKI